MSSRTLNPKQRWLLAGATILFIVHMMIFAPNGSLNPTDIQFYLAIGAGVVFGILFGYSLSRYQSNEERKSPFSGLSTAQKLIISIVISAVLIGSMIAISPNLSFSQYDQRFYAAIGLGVVVALYGFWAMQSGVAPDDSE